MYSAVGFLYLMEFLQHKHGLSEAVMDLVNILALQGYLSSLKLPQCASTVKLIHDWIPTYATLCKQKGDLALSALNVNQQWKPVIMLLHAPTLMP